MVLSGILFVGSMMMPFTIVPIRCVAGTAPTAGACCLTRDLPRPSSTEEGWAYRRTCTTRTRRHTRCAYAPAPHSKPPAAGACKASPYYYMTVRLAPSPTPQMLMYYGENYVRHKFDDPTLLAKWSQHKPYRCVAHAAAARDVHYLLLCPPCPSLKVHGAAQAQDCRGARLSRGARSRRRCGR